MICDCVLSPCLSLASSGLWDCLGSELGYLELVF